MDTGLQTLIALARFHQLPAEPEQLAHQFAQPGQSFGDTELQLSVQPHPNRVDVSLGSRLYHHLMALPLAYFEARQVGQNIARVRELDTLRNFITGTALTLIIDLFFVFVFLGVMWHYSPYCGINKRA